MLSWISAFDGQKGKVVGSATAKLSPETSVPGAKFQNYCKVNAAIACAGFFFDKNIGQDYRARMPLEGLQRHSKGCKKWGNASSRQPHCQIL
jgi:hypothetical protein